MKFQDYNSFACIKYTWEEHRLVVGVFLTRAMIASAHLQHTASRERGGVTIAIPDSCDSVSERQTMRRHYKSDGNVIILGPAGTGGGDRIPSVYYAHFFFFSNQG